MHPHSLLTAALALLPPTLAHPTLASRGATDTYGDHTGSVSSHADGSGTYVRSDDEHRYASGDKCWTDLYYVSSSQGSTDWARHGEIQCAGTSECEAGIDTGIQTCNEWSISVSAGVEASILKDLFAVSVSTTVTDGWSKCENVATSKRCKWQDGGCHAIWSSMSVKIDHGYIRRRCNKGSGDETVWSKDWDVTEKSSMIDLGCLASCEATTYVEG
ncbi:hypothetical protein G6514_009844 [Epicoccum nigrum]|nr:hypothetical protein G6514_009844 [Epicoccum nigrum]